MAPVRENLLWQGLIRAQEEVLQQMQEADHLMQEENFLVTRLHVAILQENRSAADILRGRVLEVAGQQQEALEKILRIQSRIWRMLIYLQNREQSR